MTFYSEMAQAAQELLSELGTTLTLKRTVRGDWNDTDLVYDTNTAQSQSVYGAPLPVEEEDKNIFSGDFMVREKKQKVYLSPKTAGGGALAWDPDTGHSITIDGVDWYVREVVTYDVTGTPVLHILGVSIG